MTAITDAALAVGRHVAEAAVSTRIAFPTAIRARLCTVEDTVVAAGRGAQAVVADGALAIFGAEAAGVGAAAPTEAAAVGVRLATIPDAIFAVGLGTTAVTTDAAAAVIAANAGASIGAAGAEKLLPAPSFKAVLELPVLNTKVHF